jgi:hypothetical protein
MELGVMGWVRSKRHELLLKNGIQLRLNTEAHFYYMPFVILGLAFNHCDDQWNFAGRGFLRRLGQQAGTIHKIGHLIGKFGILL